SEPGRCPLARRAPGRAGGVSPLSKRASTARHTQGGRRPRSPGISATVRAIVRSGAFLSPSRVHAARWRCRCYRKAPRCLEGGDGMEADDHRGPTGRPTNSEGEECIMRVGLLGSLAGWLAGAGFVTAQGLAPAEPLAPVVLGRPVAVAPSPTGD